MSEIVERLKSLHITRTPSASYVQVDPVTIGEATGEITRLEARVKALEGALIKAMEIVGRQVQSGAVSLADGSRRPMTPVEIELLRSSARGKQAELRDLINRAPLAHLTPAHEKGGE